MEDEIVTIDLDGPEEDLARSEFIDELFGRLLKQEDKKQNKSEE